MHAKLVRKRRTNGPIPVFTTENRDAYAYERAGGLDGVGAGLSERTTEQLDDLLQGELTRGWLIAASPDTPALTDDRPINEYYLVRKLHHDRHPQTD
jgi:hypothetical protein